jgi:hypothetical protein
MTPRDDRFPDMPSSAQFDAAIERVLRGDAVGDDAASIARFVDDMRVMADRPPPPPSPELTALLAGGAAERAAAPSVAPLARRVRGRLQPRSMPSTPRRSRSARIRMRVVAVPIAGKAAILLAIATSAAAGAAAGILPEPATHFVRRAIEVVTPFELPDDSVAHPGRTEQHVDVTGSTHADKPDDAGGRPVGLPPLAIAPGVGVAQDPDVGADDPPSMPIPMDQTSGWADTGTEPASTLPPKSAQPATSPPTGSGPKAAPPHSGSPAEPGPKTGHVPPGHTPPAMPHPTPTGSGSSDAPLTDQAPARDRQGRPAGNGPPTRPALPGGSPSDAARERPYDGPPPDVGPGPGESGEAPSSGPRPAAEHGPSTGSGQDRAQSGQPGSDAPTPADSGPWVPHQSEGGPGGSTGSAQPVDAPGPEPPPAA